MDDQEQTDFVGLAADIVSAFVAHNKVAAQDLAPLIADVYAALQKAATGEVEKPVEQVTPAVSVKKSITPDYLICLLDGKKFKSLKRHLRTAYDMSPDEYRTKFGLPADYPMVAPNYAAARSELAKASGLGQQRRKVAAAAVVEPIKKSGRKPRAKTA